MDSHPINSNSSSNIDAPHDAIDPIDLPVAAALDAASDHRPRSTTTFRPTRFRPTRFRPACFRPACFRPVRFRPTYRHPTYCRATSVSSDASGGHANRTGV